MLYKYNKIWLDKLIALITLITLSPIILIVSIAVKISSPGPLIYWSMRVGQNNNHYLMPKFRTMSVHTPTVATHLLDNPNMYLSPIGAILRKSSLDELPQLWSVLKGHMSIVGPRPALFNQYDLISERTYSNIHQLKPGITGWAQINGRDEISISNKVELDKEYKNMISFKFDIKIILLTIVKVLSRDSVTH